MLKSILRFLFGFDIFVSYARADGTLYAANLVKELADRGFSCSIDLFEAPGEHILSNVLRTVRRSRAMIVVATPRAGVSSLVAAQIEAFARAQRGRLWVIDIDGAALSATWRHLVAGLISEWETRERFNTGEPSPQLIERIEKGFRFQRRNRQLRQGALFATIAMALASLAVGILVNVGIRVNSMDGPPFPYPMAYLKWTFLTDLLVAIGASAWFPLAGAICLVAVGVLAGILGTVMVSTEKASAAKAVAERVQRSGAAAYYSSFISYSHKDRRFAVRLEKALNERGADCWRDEKQIKPGQDLFREVAKAIEERDKLLLCCSEHSLKSWWVDNELGTAFEKEQKVGKEMVIPLNLDGYLFSDEWKSGYKAQLRRRLAADFTTWKSDRKFNEQTEKLAAALQSTSSPRA